VTSLQAKYCRIINRQACSFYRDCTLLIWLTNSLTPWCKVYTCCQLVNKFHAFYGTRWCPQNLAVGSYTEPLKHSSYPSTKYV